MTKHVCDYWTRQNTENFCDFLLKYGKILRLILKSELIVGRFLEARYTNKEYVGLWEMWSLCASSHILIDHWTFFLSYFLLLAHSYKYWEHLYNNRILTYFEVICSCDLLPIYSHKLLIVTSPWLPQQYLWCHQTRLQPEAVRADQLPKNKAFFVLPC